MLYFDTSFLIPYFTAESTSSRVEAFFARQDVDQLSISLWTATEFHSAIAIKIRTGQIPASLHSAILDRFNTAQAETFHLLTPAKPDFGLAAELLRDWKSRLCSGDALHLAVAINRKATLVTLDKTLLKTARGLKLACKTL
jgi:predicted nucleic acid-binding protein